MSQRGRMAVFISIVTSVWTLLHVYVGERILGQEPLPVVWRVLGWAGLLLLAAGPVLAFTAGRSPRLPARRVIEVAGFTAMGLSSLLIVFAFAGDVLRLRAWLGAGVDRKSTRLNSSHSSISYVVFCLKKKIESMIWNYLRCCSES